MSHQGVSALRARPEATWGGAWTAASLRAATDAEVLATFADPADRAQGARSVLSAPQLSGGWAGPTGTVRVTVGLDSAASESWTVRFTTSGVRIDDRADPDAELRLPLLDLVRLLPGQADGALLHLAGTLEVTGDENLVLALGQLLRPAGLDRPVIDAAALDPVAVASAVDGVRREHLAAVMAGGFRPLVLAEVFRRLPEFLIAEKAAGARVAIGFVIGGRRDGGTDRYVVEIRDGACTVRSDAPEAARVDASLVLEGHEFLRLVLGHLPPVRGVLSGELRVEGHVIKALAFNALMQIPGR